LDRWKAVTGWDVETFAGLATSMVALDLRPEPEVNGLDA
jgi:hypothetical protein